MHSSVHRPSHSVKINIAKHFAIYCKHIFFATHCDLWQRIGAGEQERETPPVEILVVEDERPGAAWADQEAALVERVALQQLNSPDRVPGR
jgi:hypothetical protein